MPTTLPPTDPDRWQLVKRLFEEAVALPPDARDAFLDSACTDDGSPDEALRAEIDALLLADATAGAFLDDDGALTEALGLLDLPEEVPETDDVAGERVGPYRVLDLIGRGGMGEVLLAERADGLFERRVALKRARPGLGGIGTLARRFEAERRILATLQHPGIARLLDAGTSTDGRPYFAMDYVAGVPITDYVRDHDLALEERLALLAGVCEAVAYAHERHIVHRDLKPSNILVAEDSEGRPRPVLLDFGIARLLDPDAEAALTLTTPGAQPMTRAYAAPEQVRGEEASAATDVWALGTLFYELLAGRRPFAAPTPAQFEAAILHDDPSRPSDAARSPDMAATAVPAVAPSALRGDLDTIVQTALAKEPARRYASAAELAEDLRRHCEGLPIAARPPSVAYRVGKFVRRHTWGVGVATLLFVLLVAFAATVTVQQQATARERDAAEAAADFLQGLFAAADPFVEARQDTLRARDLLDRGITRINDEFADQPYVRARLLHTIGDAFVALGLLSKAEAPLEEAVALWRAEGDRGGLAQSLTALAAVYHSQRRYEDCERVAREAAALASAEGDDATRTDAEVWMALGLLDQGHTEESERMLRTSLDHLRAQYGPDAPRVSDAERALVNALIDLERFDEAAAVGRGLYERGVAQHGPGSPFLLGALRSLAFIYLTTGQLDEAEVVGAEAVEIGRATRPGSGMFSQALTAHASVLRRRGRLDEAEALLREALALPPLNPEAQAVPMGTLASVLHARGRLDEAIAAQEETVGLLQSAGESAYPFSAIKLAGYYREAARYEDCERILLSLFDEGVQAPSDHGARSIISELSTLYDAWGRPDEAAHWRARLGS